VTDLNSRNVELLAGHDVLIDGTDNFRTRYLLNDYAFQNLIPWSYAGCLSSHGMSFLFRPERTPCLRCFISEAPAPGTLDTCDTAGIIAPAVHAVASFQVAQVLKLLVGKEPQPRLFQFDVWDDQWRTILAGSPPDPNCPCCGKHEFSFLSGDAGEDRLTVLCGRDAVQIVPRQGFELNLDALAHRIEAGARVIRNPFLVRIFLPAHEITLFPDGRSIIKGTDDPSVARSLYDRYVGT
jgi:adenylyltransferase/sulfurtransferase